jgi:hypothetical protein
VSAVILAVIVIMWAVVLVPMWLRRHDAATESRSVDRFSTAMRVLSRRPTGSADRRYVLMPKRDSRASVHVSGASASRRPPTRQSPAAPPSRPQTRTPSAARSRTSLAVRRRRTFLALAGLTFLTFLLAVTGVIGWPLQFVVDLILVAFVVHLRAQAKRAAAVARQRRRAAVAPAAAAAAEAAPPAYEAVPRAYEAAAPVVDEWATAPMQPVSMQPIEAPAAEAPAATGTDDRWEPVPVPRPTYAMKPKAPQRWTYAQPQPQPQPQSSAEAEPQPADEAVAPVEPTAEVSELDGILEHRWAVND